MAKKTVQQLTSIEHGAFDTAALQQELAQALEDDRLYKLTDNMKKRAIHTASNYDEFKNLVACADLKPISQKELSEFSRAERQTNIAFKKTTSAKRPASERRFQTAPALDVPPATAVDFCRNWNRHLKTVEAKFRYLQVTTPARLADMFKPDLDSDLLAEIAQVLAASWRQKAADVSPEEPPQAAFALSTLEALARTARFSLILDFLDGCQTDKLRELFDLVEASDELQQEDLARLSSVKHKFRLG